MSCVHGLKTLSTEGVALQPNGFAMHHQNTVQNTCVTTLSLIEKRGRIMHLTILVVGQYQTLPLWWACLCDQPACYDEHDRHSTPIRTSTGAASM